MRSGKPPVDDDFEAALNEFLNRRTEYIDPSVMYPEYDGVRGRSIALFEKLIELLATEEAKKCWKNIAKRKRNCARSIRRLCRGDVFLTA